MADDDPWDDMQGVSTMALTSAARVAETLLRASQERSRRQGDRDEQLAEQANRRYEAQARVADEFYARAATPEFVREETAATVQVTRQGIDEWQGIDSERFAPYSAHMADAIVEVHGGTIEQVDATLEALRLREDAREENRDGERHLEESADKDLDEEYDSEDARTRRDQQLANSDLEPEVKTAIKIADRQNGHDPAEAATAGAAAQAESRAGGRPVRGRGRGRARTRQAGRSR